ncbi:hypothetical protein [Metaplanococcus flavidus]|uniref:Uncharacterized protein n=1 Tax=Metaplanococcus flavidus TaxID=569883 RepID=A0ABW3LDV4_9BACL
MVEIILEVIAYVFSYFVTPQKRLEKNVKVLKNERWFAELEDDFRYNHLIWNNRTVIRYLALNSNVDKLLKDDDDEKAKFKKLLTYEHVKFITAP